MNLFETAQPRTWCDNPVQLVKHLCDLTDKARAKLENQEIFAELKEDGVYAFLHNDVFYSRAGLPLTNLEHLVVHANVCSRHQVPIFEVVNDSKAVSLEDLSGFISPNRVKPLTAEQAIQHEATRLVVHDMIPLNDFEDGHCRIPYRQRRSAYLGVYHWNYDIADYISCVISQEVESVERLEDLANAWIACGHEGGVGKLANGDWKAGRRDHNVVKIVRELSFDLRCKGVLSGKGKREGTCALMEFEWKDGKTLVADLGKGWDDKKRLEAWLNPPIGKIFRVTAMQESSQNGLLRKARVQDERHDKTTADY